SESILKSTNVTALIAAVLLLAPATAWSQAGPLPPGASAPSDAMHNMGRSGSGEVKPLVVQDNHKQGTATFRVLVRRQIERVEDAPFAPTAGQRVILEWVG